MNIVADPFRERNEVDRVFRTFVQEHVEACQKAKAQGKETTPFSLSIPEGTDLSYMNLFQGNFDGCNFDGCNLNYVVANHCSFKGASFVEADMSSMKAYGSDFRDANLRRSDMRFGDFRKADFTGADLTGAQQEHAKFKSLTWKEAYGD